MRKAIIFDGNAWFVRRIRAIEHARDRDEKVYYCDKPISNDHPALSEVPEVKALIREYQVALSESVKLQCHYAMLLNGYDGGKRRGFRSADDWIDRLRETGTLRKTK